MNDYEIKLKQSLFCILEDMGKHTHDFVYNPGKDCTRNRKLGFVDFMHFTLSMGAKSTNNELLRYFDYSMDAPSPSAYNQQRAKIKPEAFHFWFDTFTKTLSQDKTYLGYKLIACDGSDINITRGKKGDATLIQSGSKRAYSLMHVSAFYDLLNGFYLDAIVHAKKETDEKGECVTMIDRSRFEKILLICDRGYENYNLFAHAQEKGWKYLIRAKDINTKNGIVYGCHLGLSGEFDTTKDIILTRNDRKRPPEQRGVYKSLNASSRRFDYLPPDDLEREYPMRLRIVRIKISENNYETLITNLSPIEISMEGLKELYHMRWGIETSFREIKYYVGMLNLHAKKPDYVSQEIYANLIIYNFCKAVTNRITVPEKPAQKYQYRLNMSAAVSICRQFLFERYAVLSELEMLIRKYLTPIRLNRSFPRKVVDKKPVSLNYRPA